MNMNIDNCSNPWKDIASYEIADASCFQGREKAIKKFLDIIDNGAFSVLYSASGIGKTSFVQAGIEPAMMRENYVPVHVRFINDAIYKIKEERIEEEIINIIEDQLTKRGFSWTASFEKWPSDAYDEKGESLQSICEKSLWWRFYTFKVTKGESETYYRPLFVFDQFEETFIKANKYHNSQFLISFFQIFEELSTPVLPIRIEKVMNILFDRGIRYKVKSIREFKVLFSLRKEYLSDFDNWTNDQFQISELLQNRMLLYPLSRSQAERVITQQPLIDINGNIVYGEHTETLIHVKDLILDKLDARHHNEIEPFFLSLLCSRLFDLAKTKSKEILSPSDVESIDMKTILKVFYEERVKDIFKDNVKDLEAFEDLIIDEDGYRNRIRTTKFINIDFDLYKQELVNNHIVRVEKYSEEAEYVELVHDLLCHIIKERKEEREKILIIRCQNQQRIQNDLNVLTLRGRRLLDNTLDFGSFLNASINSPFDEENLYYFTDSLLDFNFRYLYHDDVILDRFSRNHNMEEQSILFEYRNDKGEPIRSIDGITKFELYYEKNEQRVQFVETIKTINGNIDRPFYINGYCGISVKYETISNSPSQNRLQIRETERTYLDENNKPIITIDGYAMVKRYYDDNGNVEKVLYFNNEQTPQPCPHRNGNYGFTSKYDIWGREIERVFIDNEGKPKEVTSGIFGRRFKYEENRITREINIGESQEIIRDKDGFCAVEFEYDEESRLSRETYLDENLNKMIGKDGDCVTLTTYYMHDDGSFILEERYLDDHDNVVYLSLPIGNFHIRRDSYNQWLKPIRSERYYNEQEQSSMTLLYDYENFRLSRIGLQVGRFSIGNWWIEMDKRNQYVEKAGKYNQKGGKEEDEGAYGKLYMRDGNTHSPIGFLYLNFFGEPAVNEIGIYEHRFECGGGKIIRDLYFNERGKPKADNMGVFGRHYEYNQKGDCIKESFMGEDGTTIIENKIGCAYLVTEYNGNNIDSVKYFNKNDDNTTDENGDYCQKYEYIKQDNYTEERCISCNFFENAHNNKLGYCTIVTKRDALGRVILVQKLDKYNNIVDRIVQYDYNDDDNQLVMSYLDSDHNLRIGPSGWARGIMQYDKNGRIIYHAILDENNRSIMNPHKYIYYQDRVFHDCNLNYQNDLELNVNGYAIKETTLDERGREVKIRFLGIQGEPVFASEGYHGYIIKYIANKRIETIIDKNEEISEDKFGISKRIIIVNQANQPEYEFYYDIKGNPKRNKIHDYGALYRYDDKKIIHVGLDKNGKPHKNKYGIAESVIEEGRRSLYLDEKGKEVGVLRIGFNGFLSLFRIQKTKNIMHSMICMHVIRDGLFRNAGLEGYFLLLQYNDWKEGMSTNILEEELNKKEGNLNIKFIRLNLTFQGLTIGEIYNNQSLYQNLGVSSKIQDITEGLYREIMLLNNQ